MHWITKTYRGLHVTRRPDAELPAHVLATFRHACDAFAHLVHRGERITPLDWCERIESTYAPGPRRSRVVGAIQCAMLPRGGVLIDARPGIEPVPLPLDYARAGYAGALNTYPEGSAACMAHSLGAYLRDTGADEPRTLTVRPLDGFALTESASYQQTARGFRLVGD